MDCVYNVTVRSFLDSYIDLFLVSQGTIYNELLGRFNEDVAAMKKGFKVK